MARILTTLLAALPAAVACAETVTVKDARSLQRALEASRGRDMTIVVDGPIELQGRPLHVPKSDSTVDLLGINNAAINFGMYWDGDWTRNGRPANGLELNCGSAFLRGIAFSGYEWKGSAVKFHGSRLLHVQDCVFNGVSTKPWPSRTGGRAQTADDVWFGNAVGGGAQADLIVSGCTFERVATSDAYAHCIYAMDARTLVISRCTFKACGQPVVTWADVVRLNGNTYRDLVRVPTAYYPGSPLVWNYWVEPGRAKSLVATHETFINATFRWPVRHYADPARHCFEFNDYSGLSIQRDAAGPGKWLPPQSSQHPGLDWAEWRRLGFDLQSRPPGAAPSSLPAN